MNGNEKSVLNEIFEKMGKVEANTDAIIKRLDDGDKRINVLEESVTKNSISIKYIYGGIGIIVTAIIGTIFKFWDKLLGR